MRRCHWPFLANRFIGDASTMCVHDVEMETASCLIDRISPEDVVVFEPDSLFVARATGYHECACCIGLSIP